MLKVYTGKYDIWSVAHSNTANCSGGRDLNLIFLVFFSALLIFSDANFLPVALLELKRFIIDL